MSSSISEGLAEASRTRRLRGLQGSAPPIHPACQAHPPPPQVPGCLPLGPLLPPTASPQLPSAPPPRSLGHLGLTQQPWQGLGHLDMFKPENAWKDKTNTQYCIGNAQSLYVLSVTICFDQDKFKIELSPLGPLANRPPAWLMTFDMFPAISDPAHPWMILLHRPRRIR